MTRTVGSRDRNEFVLDPVEAWRRGRVLDRQLRAAWPALPVGVTRAPHRVFNELDDRRQLVQARQLNPPPRHG